MRDLLTDLVRRTRRPESTVQPRLPSAYEASSAVAHELVVDQETTRGPLSRPLPLPQRSQAEPEHTPPRRDGHDSPAPAVALRRATPLQPQSVDRPARPAPAATPALHDVAPRVAPLATPATPGGPASVPAAVVASAPSPRLPAADVPPRQAPPRVVSPNQPMVRTEVQSLRRLQAGAARDDAGNTGERPAPEIRISIGRIEVRASAAERVPARKPAPASASPLTLDEYLAARGRRGSR